MVVVQAGKDTFPQTVVATQCADICIKDFGGVGDYAGTPQYDGNDGTRITATDNTVAFNALINEAIAQGHCSVKIPAGHWGIKVGNLAFSAFNRLRIVGEGIGVTILDFIKEDSSHFGVIVQDAQAQCIARFTTGNSLEFADMTIKATTKGGIVNTRGRETSVYEGAIWGFILRDIADVRFTRVRAEHFNYRGFSVHGTATQRVLALDCEGFYNTGSGYWIEDAASFEVAGGEFAYNGVFGDTGTGYGVTASRFVGKFLVQGVRAHHNYRKGIDSHGCAQFTVKDSTFENNVLFHIACPNNLPPAGVTDIQLVIKGNTFSNGRLQADRDWLASCYAALVVNGFALLNPTGGIMTLTDRTQAGIDTTNITSIIIEGNEVLYHYNGGRVPGVLTAAPLVGIIGVAARLEMRNNRWNFDGAEFPATGDIYSHIALQVATFGVNFANNLVRIPATQQYTRTSDGGTDRGLVLGVTGGAMTLELSNNQFDINDAFLVGATGDGNRYASNAWTIAGSVRSARGNNFNYLSDPYRDEFSLNNAFFLGTDAAANIVPLQSSNNVFVRAGFKYSMPEHLGQTLGRLAWGLSSKPLGADVMAIVLDRTYQALIRVATNDATPDLILRIPYSSYLSITGTTTNGLLEYSSSNSSFVENGVTKIRIVLRAKVALVGSFWGSISIEGGKPGLGLERVDYL